MKKFHKLVAIALTLLMVIGVFPTAALAVQAGDPATDLRYAYTAQESVQVADPDEWVTVIVELDGDTTLDKSDFVEAFRQSSKGFSADQTVAAYRKTLVQQHENVAAQISAINSALNSFNKVLLASHMKSCVVEDIQAGKGDEAIDELAALLQKVMK